MTDARSFLLEDPAIAEAVANGYDIRMDEEKWLRKMEAFAWAYFTRTDLRRLLLHHPDRQEVTTACLHFLGDAAQEWWAEQQHNTFHQTSHTMDLTFGQKAVGIRFNPSENPEVTRTKQNFAAVIDHLNQLRTEATSPEVKRQLSIAITEAQTAQMWAVKAITWQD